MSGNVRDPRVSPAIGDPGGRGFGDPNARRGKDASMLPTASMRRFIIIYILYSCFLSPQMMEAREVKNFARKLSLQEHLLDGEAMFVAA